MITEERIRELRDQNTVKMIFSPAGGGKPETVEKLDSMAFARAIEREVLKHAKAAISNTQANVMGSFQELSNDMYLLLRDSREEYAAPAIRTGAQLAYRRALCYTDNRKNLAEIEFTQLGSLMEKLA